MKIGFFDSGVGGITVLYQALKALPNEDYVYYADTVNVPYGPRTKDEVRQFIMEAVDFIVKQQVQVIVIACNTATSVAIEELRFKYKIPIIGMEPAVKPAIENTNKADKRVLVTATALTLKEEKLHNLITKLDNEHIVDLLPLPGLVQFAEQLEFREEIVLPYLKEALADYDVSQYEAVVLGCTHFTYFKDLFKKIFQADTSIIDGNTGTINNLVRTIKNLEGVSKGSGIIDYFQSGRKVVDKESLNKYELLMNRLEEVIGRS